VGLRRTPRRNTSATCTFKCAEQRVGRVVSPRSSPSQTSQDTHSLAHVATERKVASLLPKTVGKVYLVLLLASWILLGLGFFGRSHCKVTTKWRTWSPLWKATLQRSHGLLSRNWDGFRSAYYHFRPNCRSCYVTGPQEKAIISNNTRVNWLSLSRPAPW
jgi:hypothetical protein